MQKTVSLPFMLLGILFNVCLVASNLLETKVIQLGPITATAGLIVFPISYIINDCIAEVWGFKKASVLRVWLLLCLQHLFGREKKVSISYSVWPHG